MSDEVKYTRVHNRGGTWLAAIGDTLVCHRDGWEDREDAEERADRVDYEIGQIVERAIAADRLALLTSLREAVALVTEFVGCGDSSCRFVAPKGMATNGGCRCIGRGEHRPGVPGALAKLYKAALRVVDTRPSGGGGGR